MRRVKILRNDKACVPDPNSIVSNPGSPDRVLYDSRLTKEGIVEVVPSGMENYQEYIESFRSQTDFAYILKQIALGNGEVLNQSVGQYGDFTNMPKSLAEALQMDIDAEKAFNKLALDIKQKFNNNYREWLFNIGSDEWNQKMNILPQIEEKGDVPPSEDA